MLPYLKEFWSQRLIWFLFSVLLVSGGGVVATSAGARMMTIVALCAGAVLIILIEYVVHRYILHEFPRIAPFAYQGHVAHHQAPNELKYLFGPVTFDACAYPVILLVTLFVTSFEWHLSWSLVFGASAFQIYYQWKHYISHRPIVPLTPWGKWLKKRHLLHHHLDEKTWYGVSNPFLDIIMRTNKPLSSNPPNNTSQNNKRMPS